MLPPPPSTPSVRVCTQTVNSKIQSINSTMETLMRIQRWAGGTNSPCLTPKAHLPTNAEVPVRLWTSRSRWEIYTTYSCDRGSQKTRRTYASHQAYEYYGPDATPSKTTRRRVKCQRHSQEEDKVETLEIGYASRTRVTG
ncbi:uncharacterized protein MELLADRAFT_112658 [Melampsora larici-populina 98AG31]|uniref:Uncharacterized protein n=1 Tax=Melampsora larici-populina (strain 98AG31 / pathotype 3-4-7) TaxID=747676 RepID=F4S768_MELLP|nr:uncharacterized protein MELLADRAFT_112658 [Melampsora larici-populina 98AG31]EGF99457.1 hypothetical protein MELLADRAFT_112658 [Melampsora larici-populina 98AG31]